MDILDGKYVSNGDKNVFVKILGEGKTTIVIEPGWGSLSLEWENIQKELAKYTRVVTYDRPGYAESPKASNPRISGQIADELYNTLKNAGIDAPYILVGHNGGGLYVQHFVKMYSGDVAGLVLVDSLSVKDIEFDELDVPNYHKIISHKTKLDNFRQFSEMEKEEFEKIITPMIVTLKENYPENIREAMLSYLTDQNLYKTIYEEMEQRDESIKYLEQLSIFMNIPVKILCRDFDVMTVLAESLGITVQEARMIEEQWIKNTKTLLNLSVESDMEIVRGASHNIHLDRPEIVIKSILGTLDKVLVE
jgi:pimeloyl-ACP methyl ester carboxylesterase